MVHELSNDVASLDSTSTCPHEVDVILNTASPQAPFEPSIT